MTISVTCACGKEYRLGDDKAGRRFDCRECGTEVRVPNLEETAAQRPDVTGVDDVDEATPVRFVPAAKRRSKRKRADSESNTPDQSPLWSGFSSQPLWLRGSLIASVIVAIMGVCWATQTMSYLLMFTTGGFALFTLIGWPLLIDHFNRQRIREEIAGYGGTVHRIQWRPFQGAFFSTGWTRRRGVRFYDVTYNDRDGQHRSGLCAVSFWGGTAWDEDIDSSFGWSSPEDSRQLLLIAGAVVLVLVAGVFVGVETFYSIYGETTSATVTKVHRYETSRRVSRGGTSTRRHQTRLDIHYTYKSKDGTEQHGASNQLLSVLNNTIHEGGTVKVQYIPGNSRWSRIVSSSHATYSPLFYLTLLAALIVVPFAILFLLDYLDVFKLHK